MPPTQIPGVAVFLTLEALPNHQNRLAANIRDANRQLFTPGWTAIAIMDILPNSASLLARAGTTPTVDIGPANGLLRSLLRAGVVEAEVVQRLPTELLLNTRLGPLRVERSLNFEVGERIRLRVDQSGELPVLRVERQLPQPLRLALAQHPQLARALLAFLGVCRKVDGPCPRRMV